MYPPSEDSFFFAEFLQEKLKKLSKKEKTELKFLDVGTGSGILAETAKKLGIKNLLALDIDKESVNYVKKKGINVIHSDLFKKIKKLEKFDIITFNAPYLPEDKFGIDKGKDTTGGKKGDEIPLRFLKQAKSHLNKNGKIFLLVSSLTPKSKIKKFKPKLVAKKRIFFEDLGIWEIKNT